MTFHSRSLRLVAGVGSVCAAALGAQDSQHRPRVAIMVGGTRIGFPDVYMPSSSALTGAARLRVMQRGDVFAVASAHLVLPLSVTAIEASCPPTADCASRLSPASLVGGSVGLGRRLGDKLTIAGHLGTVNASGMQGAGPATRASLGAELSWALSSGRLSPVLGLTAVSFLGDLAGARGYLTPTIGIAW